MMHLRIAAVAWILCTLGGYGFAEPPADSSALQPVNFTAVRVEDAFWAPRIAINRAKVLPANFKHCQETGRIDNFAKAGKLMEGKFRGIFFDDSDVYKVLEGTAYSLAHKRDADLEKIADDVIDKIASAQLPDGYLYTFYTVNKTLDLRWSEERKMHETYCAGHMIEAAIAYYQATGKRKFLDVATRVADHMCTVFGPDKKHDPPGHEEVELALMKLWRVTGAEKYRTLARFLVDERGQAKTHKLYGDYAQDHKPVREQREIVGHAVRAMYLFSAVADLAAATGDAGYIQTMDAIWNDVTGRKMYITGGIGPSSHNEGFTVPYDLPNDTAYCETCASIGMALWNQRMALLHADARYADVVERVMYNGILSGVSLDGEKFFYVNPMASKGKHHRQAWFGCACCPTNMVRFLPTVGGYAYAGGGNAAYVNQYIAGSAAIKLADNTVALKVETRYPWEGDVKFTVSPQKEATFDLNLRVPGWCQGAPSTDDLYPCPGRPASGRVAIKINGQPLSTVEIVKGYARINRPWKSEDVVELSLPMEIHRVFASSNVKADVGRVALQRGPIVYCLEAVDNGGSVRNIVLPRDSQLAAEHCADLLNGVTVLKGKALAASRKAEDSLQVETRPVDILAVPYYSWDNRAPGQMTVWLPEEAALADVGPLPRKATLAALSTVSASHTWKADTIDALQDQIEPKRSDDESIPRFTWWDHKGTAEWVQYLFAKPATVSTVEVYWFDDNGHGSCRVPGSWKLLYQDNQQWKPVEQSSGFDTKVNQYNRVTFKPVNTTGLRIEVQLQDRASGGILEWKVE